MSPTARIASDGVLVGMEDAIRHVPGFDSGWRGYNHQRLWIPRLEISRMTGRGKKRHWIPDLVGDDSKGGGETTGLENLGYQRPERVDDRFGFSRALRLGERAVLVGFLRFFLFTM